MRRSANILLSAAFLPLLVSPTLVQAQGANTFNRLHTTLGDRNAPPTSDGLHDPSIEGAQLLQAPKEAFEGLPKAVGGNYVDWGQALKGGKIAPRYDSADSKAKPELMDLDVIRECKGSTPNAVFPHAAHSEWIDCGTCHPAIFESAKGANTMTMAEIMAGKKCGVCHGTVAFPVSECKRCHYQAKDGSMRKTTAQEGSSQAKKGKGGVRLPWSGRGN